MADVEVSRLVELSENWIGQKTGEELTDVQKAVLRQALAGYRLKDIKVSGYTANTIQREIAPKLWKLLSNATGKKVTVKTVRLVLEELQGRRSQFSISPEAPQHASLLRRSPQPESEEAERPGGQVNLTSKFYVERPPIESRAFEEIAKPGSLIRIKAPQQMGKTSLMSRLLDAAEERGCRSVIFNFDEEVDSKDFADLDRFLRRFCATIADNLNLQPEELDNYWSKSLGSKKNCTNFFEKYLLPKIGAPLALGLDAVDLIFPHEKVADDFFGLLRAWHEKAKQNDLWKNFRLVIVHGTEVYIPLTNDQSPFNVGLPIELPEFNARQVSDLARRHGLNFTEAHVAQLMAVVGGHPHLVRMALYKIAREEIGLEQILEEAPTETGIYGDRLRSLLGNLEQNPELESAFREVVEADFPVQLKAAIAYKLNSMGLVHLQGNQVTVRNELYRQYFRDRFGFYSRGAARPPLEPARTEALRSFS